MEIVFVREKQNSKDILSQVKDSVISRIQQAVNVTNETETVILPVVPEDNPFKSLSDVKNYKGLAKDYNIPAHKNLKSFTWNSLFPVNKSYSWQHAASNINGYDYVDFIEERQRNELPFRLIAYSRNTMTRTVSNIAGELYNSGVSSSILTTPIRTHFDGLVLVKDFDYTVDKVRDIKYTITLEEFNPDILKPSDNKIDWTQAGVTTVSNIVTRYALKSAGLI